MTTGQKTKALPILGDKGGVDKTMVAGPVYDWLRAKEISTNVWDFDGDRTLIPGGQ